MKHVKAFDVTFLNTAEIESGVYEIDQNLSHTGTELFDFKTAQIEYGISEAGFFNELKKGLVKVPYGLGVEGTLCKAHDGVSNSNAHGSLSK